MPVINRSSFILPLSGVRLRRETPPKNQQSAPVSENSRPSPCPVWGIPHCPSIPAHRPLFIAASCVNATLERQPNTTQHKRYGLTCGRRSFHIHTAPIPSFYWDFNEYTMNTGRILNYYGYYIFVLQFDAKSRVLKTAWFKVLLYLVNIVLITNKYIRS